MTTFDITNATFEVLGGLFVLNHCRVLFKDKMLKGVSVLSTVFFNAWGAWNLFYYPHLGQWASFFGGLAICIANALWIGLALFYRRRQKIFISIMEKKSRELANAVSEDFDYQIFSLLSASTPSYVCRRCKAAVIKGRCKCTTSPSPWQPLDICPECDRSPCRCSERPQ